MSLLSRFREIGALLLGVHVLGVIGYMIIEDWEPFDALYMTVITIATVGYGETRPLTTGGRVFTIALIYIGIGTFTYAVSSVAAYWVESQVFGLWERRRMERRIAQLRDHIIICGGGKTTLDIAEELIQTRTPFVIVDRHEEDNEAMLEEFGEEILHLRGDPGDPGVLRQVGIERARGLVACMPDDRENLLTIFEARHLSPSLRIVSRLVDEEARQRLLRAGADSIVPMQRIGALRIASEMLRPHVVSVLDVMLREPGRIRVQQIPVGPGGAGKSLEGLGLQETVGITIFAMREAGSLHHVFNPLPERILREGDILIGCADPDQLAVAQLIADRGMPAERSPD